VPESLSQLSEIVQLWFASLRAEPEQVEKLFLLLDKEEQQRAARLRGANDRNEFTVAHAFFRQVLAFHLGISPQDIGFRYEPHGKPALAHSAELQFNFSHSGDVAVVAVAQNPRVGIDVEVMRELPDLIDMCQRYFCPSETSRIMASAGEAQCRSFYMHWTGKEAYLKAQGDGLFTPLNSFEVIPPGTGPEPSLKIGDARERGDWSIRWFQPRDEVMCAVVAEGLDWRLKAAKWLPVEGRSSTDTRL